MCWISKIFDRFQKVTRDLFVTQFIDDARRYPLNYYCLWNGNPEQKTLKKLSKTTKGVDVMIPTPPSGRKLKLWHTAHIGIEAVNQMQS